MTHVLLVEDSDTQAEILSNWLLEMGYRVSVAADGREALEKFGVEPADLVVSDIAMPGMDGYELCGKLKSQSSVPIVLLTALGEVEDVLRGLLAGADSYLVKPCRKEHLEARLKAVLELQTHSGQGDDLEVQVGGRVGRITADRRQIFNLLIAVFANAVEQNRLLDSANAELRRAQDQLAEANATLGVLNQQKDELLGMAAHDLRSPLNAILGYSRLGLERFSHTADPALLRFLESIASSAEVMLKLVTDLLDVTALESGRLRLHLEKVDLSRLVRRCVELMQLAAEQKKITIQVEDRGGLPRVEADGPKIEQVVTNLLSNAIKFSHPNSTVRVRLSRSSGGVVVDVEDHGHGIASREQLKLFRPFSRISVQGTAGEKNTGLGLFIAKKIIEGHGGTIWVESQKNGGSVFSFLLPEKSKTPPLSSALPGSE
ncbi:MAG: hybrid sensor histidine kinase/response regulator [Armatimonadetes bacterium]|nr:hybrid sensor histidine kinase/response regulator [Armatimonadota bacterium]